uniref:Uncharacterized protein n=1 Tax=Myoviridae sp. ct3pM2 TaxID=2827658 RepID=A0A8S5TDQ0_9CAUD|nr:MAG TPA: hypothetical protein [Myoviridae sp. ct3pM2]
MLINPTKPNFGSDLTLVLDLFYVLTLHLFSKSLSMALY